MAEIDWNAPAKLYYRINGRDRAELSNATVRDCVIHARSLADADVDQLVIKMDDRSEEIAGRDISGLIAKL
ncbi:hypothetical protein DAH55_03975 [Sphingomonas koreensis]|uniref:hypothetical protein n=1 Tax=Sphingomonas koreensis TaxID=93064 RepID=UPI000834990F|nr:hypothetical protein [Sphingomonas koreensis]PJI89040.1 hypothetical protein BDW16_2343 [Sphingomonas koreensis]RSU63378.1 hypothetical protein DAH56_00430 [Sphingomonas koreensis]RSU71043.1 hypothetical protein DAH55_03975 [Sphingomonas koreensis]